MQCLNVNFIEETSQRIGQARHFVDCDTVKQEYEYERPAERDGCLVSVSPLEIWMILRGFMRYYINLIVLLINRFSERLMYLG